MDSGVSERAIDEIWNDAKARYADGSRKPRLERLRRAVQEGIDSLDHGDSIVLQTEQELRDHIAAIGREARTPST